MILASRIELTTELATVPQKLAMTKTSKKSPHKLLAQERIINAWDSLQKPPSVLFFTTHKCASVFVEKLLKTIVKTSPYQVRNYAAAIWQLGDRVDPGTPYEDFLEAAYDQLYHARGEIYAPQRRPLNFPGRERFKHIFFLRDPRDVLVSAYYSFGYQHQRPKAEKQQEIFSQDRQRIQDQGIDNYALTAASDWLLPLYTQYQLLLETSTSHLYVNYDQYKDNTAQFILTIADYLETSMTDEDVQALISEAAPVQAVKDIQQHKRSGKSQQYLEELKPETIATLNEMFLELLVYWKFDVS